MIKSFKIWLEERGQSSSIMFHTTRRSNLERILLSGLKINQEATGFTFRVGGNIPNLIRLGLKEDYGCNPVFLDSRPTYDKHLTSDAVILEVDVRGLNLTPDLETVTEYYPLDDELNNFILENGELLAIKDAMENREIADSLIRLTGTATSCEDIAPSRIRIL